MRSIAHTSKHQDQDQVVPGRSLAIETRVELFGIKIESSSMMLQMSSDLSLVLGEVADCSSVGYSGRLPVGT